MTRWPAIIRTTLSGYFGFSGVASCGCLGAVQASPWWAFGIDVAALALLALARPHDEPSTIRQPIQIGVKWAGVVVVLLTGTMVVVTVWHGSPEAALARLCGQELIATDVELGSGKPGELIEGRTTVYNWSDRTVRLVGGTSDCSCTTINDLPLQIESGGSAVVSVQVEIAEGKSGQFERNVVLRVDGPTRSMIRFRITYWVE